MASIAVAPTPGGESARARFFLGSRTCQSNFIRMASSLGDNIIDHVVWLTAEFLWHTVLSNENGEFYASDIYIRAWTGRYVFEWDRLLDEGFFFQAGVPSCSDNVTHRSCANFKYEVADVNNGIPIDFRAIKCLTVESGQPCRDNISWYIQLDWFVQQLFSLDSICMMFTTRDWLLWLPVDHSRQPVTLKWDGEKPWIGVNCIFQENIWSENC